MAKYKLTVGGRQFRTDGAQPEATLETIRVAYEEPRELRFRWFGDNCLKQSVELTVDGVVRFAGTALTRRRSPSFGKADLVTAYGYEELARGLDLKDPLTNYPLLGFSTKSMQEILEKIITQSLSAELQGLGIRAEFVGATGEVVPNVQIRGFSLADTLSVLADSVPGFTWLIDPATKVFRIVNVFNAPDLTLTIGEDVVGINDFDVTESLRDRYTALRLIGSVEPLLIDRHYQLQHGWPAELEKEWSIDACEESTEAAKKTPVKEGLEDVFRKFDFSEVKDEILWSQEVRMVHAVKRPDETEHYHSIRIADVDRENGFVWSSEPVVRTVKSNSARVPNMRAKGKAKAPQGVFLAYKTSVDVIPGMRVPAAGFTGSAFSGYGLAREKVVYEQSNADVTIQRALRLLEVRKDVNYEGRVPLPGDVPAEIWNLYRRVSFAMSGGKKSGYENARAVLRGFEHSFTRRRTLLEIGSDKSAFLGETAD